MTTMMTAMSLSQRAPRLSPLLIAERKLFISVSAHSPRRVARVCEGEIPGAQLVQHPQDRQTLPDGVAPLDPY